MDISVMLENIIKSDPDLANLDISEGSVYYDIYIKPLKILYEEHLSGIVEGSSSYSYEDIEQMSIDKLASIASMHGIYPFSAKSYTYAELVFSDTTTCVIPKGSVFRSKNSEWTNSSDDIYVSSSSLTQSGSVYILSGILLSNDAGLSLSSNQINQLDNPPATLIKIRNTPSFGGGVERTKTELNTLIKGSVYHDLKYQLSRKFPAVKTTIVGANDELMKRDIVYAIQPYGLDFKKRSDYKGKIRGDSYSNPNVCYGYSIVDKDHDFVPDYSYEISQNDYIALMNPLDAPLTLSTDNVLLESFDSYGERVGVRTEVLSIDNLNVFVANPRAFSIGDYVRFAKEGTVVKLSSVKAICKSEYDCSNVTVNGVDYVSVPLSAEIFVHAGYTAYLYSSTGNHVSVEISNVTKRETDILFATVAGYDLTPVRAMFINLSLSSCPTYSAGLDLELVDSEGLSLGGGWVKSEDGMQIGVCSNDREAMVVNGKLVLGHTFADADINIAMSFINKIGQMRFTNAVLNATVLVRGNEELLEDTGDTYDNK